MDYEVEFNVQTKTADGETKMLGCGCGCSFNGSVSVSNTKIVDISVNETGLTVMQSSVDKFINIERNP